MEKNYLTKDKIIGKQVADTQAMIIGTVKDLSFDLVAKQIALTITTKKGKDINIGSENVNAIGDIILLNNTISELTKPTSPSSSTTPEPSTTTAPTPLKEPASQDKPKPTKGLCPSCEYQNDPTNKFCIKCGSKL